MELAHLHQLSELEQTYWWHVAKRQRVLSWLEEFVPPPGLIIEGGIGSAGNLLDFQQRGYDVLGLDIMPEAVAYGQQLGLDHVLQHDLQQPWPAAEASARAVVLLDVIEHTADPVTVLHHARQVLSPDGLLILTVPAYPWLFGDWDRALGHYRRYTRRLLLQQTAAAGFIPRRLTHWNSFTLPAAVGLRTWQRLRPASRSAEFPQVSPVMNQLLLRCAQLERRVSDYVPIPAGLSLAGVFAVSPSHPLN